MESVGPRPQADTAVRRCDGRTDGFTDTHTNRKPDRQKDMLTERALGLQLSWRSKACGTNLYYAWCRAGQILKENPSNLGFPID